jgi:hypothetical protein
MPSIISSICFELKPDSSSAIKSLEFVSAKLSASLGVTKNTPANRVKRKNVSRMPGKEPILAIKIPKNKATGEKSF